VRFRRLLSVVTLVALALSALTACQTKVGQAAQVDGTSLSDSALSDFVLPGAAPYTDGSGARVVPKINALTNWVRNELVGATIAKHGGVATTQELNNARAVIVGSGLPDQIKKANGGHGYSNSFFSLLTDQYVLLVVLIQRLAKKGTATQAFKVLQSGQANQAFVNAIDATHTPVHISPRYGTWDEKGGLHVSDDPTSGAPDFVSFG
jgi:hypothetical protein